MDNFIFNFRIKAAPEKLPTIVLGAEIYLLKVNLHREVEKAYLVDRFGYHTIFTSLHNLLKETEIEYVYGSKVGED